MCFYFQGQSSLLKPFQFKRSHNYIQKIAILIILQGHQAEKYEMKSEILSKMSSE